MLKLSCSLLLLASLVCAHSPAAADGSDLQSTVEAVARTHHGQLTLYAENLNTGASVAIEPDKQVQTASVIKLAILFEALEQIRSGTAKWEDRLTLTKQDQVPGSGVLLFFDTPLPVTLKDAVSMMITMSDNTATNLVIEHLGFANINHRIESLGLRKTYLYNKVFAHSPQPLPPERESDHKKFGLGSTTAREMASIIRRIYYCQLGDSKDPASASDLMLCGTAMEMLSKQFYRDSIPRYLDDWIAPGTGSGTALGNKTGSLDRVRNDVALIAGKSAPIIISAFTFENQDQSWQVDNAAEIVIAKIAKSIVEAWSPEGLSPQDYKPHVQR